MIGAVIGGMTNSLAIKMLFRPYKEIRIGGWRVPFTPGLIPKRHDELSTQLGRMVVQYLLTAEGLGKKLKSTAFVSSVTAWLQGEVLKMLHSEISIAEFLEKQVHVQQPKEKLKGKTEALIANGLERFFKENRIKQIGEVVPESFLAKADQLIPQLADFILERGQAFLNSPEGKQQLSQMIERFLFDKGTLVNMISMFLGNERLVDKVQPELVKFLKNTGTKKLLEDVLTNEWERLKERKFEEIEAHVNKEEVMSLIVNTVYKNVPVFEWFEKPMKAWTSNFEKIVINEWVPTGVHLASDLLFDHLEALLERLHLEEIVREQVQTFSVDKLEDLVLSISKKEFKMITYLGALLGGMIGFIQAFIVLTVR